MRTFEALVCPTCNAFEQKVDDLPLRCVGEDVPGAPRHRAVNMRPCTLVSLTDAAEELRSTREWGRPDDQHLLDDVAEWIERTWTP